MPCPSTRSPRDRATTPAAAAVAAIAVWIVALSVPFGACSRRAHAEEGAVKQAQAEYRRGEIAFKAERYEEAIAAWERGYALAPRPLFIVNLGHAERRRGQLRKALALYKRYLVVDPETSLRGEVQQVIADLEDAIAAEEAAQAPRAIAPAPRAAEALPAHAAATPAPPPAPRPFYTRWWFWTAAGAAAAGAVAAVLLLGPGNADYQERGTLGDFRRRGP